jgi:hypothetical protein
VQEGRGNVVLAPIGAAGSAAVAACIRAHAAIKGRLEDFERAQSEATLWLRVLVSVQEGRGNALTAIGSAILWVWRGRG